MFCEISLSGFEPYIWFHLSLRRLKKAIQCWLQPNTLYSQKTKEYKKKLYYDETTNAEEEEDHR